MSRTWTNVVRFAVAALLGLAACLVAWWPQSAAGSGDAALAPVAAAPTQNTPTPTKTPTATVDPTRTPTAAPTTAVPPAQPTAQPTKKPTHKPSHSTGGNHHPPVLHNSGGSHSSGSNHSGGSHNPPPAVQTHTTTVPTSAPYTPPPATAPVKPTQAATSAPTAAPTTQATETAAPGNGETTNGDAATDDADPYDTYDAYLTSSEPVQTQSAPVWVVPGILLVLTSMLALLGGVLGRGNRPALAPVKASNENGSGDES